MQLVSTMGQYLSGGRYLAAGAVFDERNDARAKYLVSLGWATPAPEGSVAQATTVRPKAEHNTPRATEIRWIETEDAAAQRMAAEVVAMYRAHKGSH